MSGLQMKVTNAGRAALVNAQNNGTAPVLIAQIGVTGTAFTANPDGSDATLPGEIKRLSTIAGIVVADDTMHVTIRDDSNDSYTVRGLALYLEDGTLFALYGQAGVILEKSEQATMLLAADVTLADIAAVALTFGDASFSNPPATTEVQGVTEYATDAEALTGTDPARSITAKALKFVLDSRFGAGAPSAFVKTLLSLATATAIRGSLELKSAALLDTGAGNGLDADKLDGQHGAYYLDWANLTNKPATFAPSAHTQDWSTITGKPATFAPSPHTHAAADITAGTFADARIAQSNVVQHQGALSIGWGQLAGVPANFPPSAHTQDWGTITGKPATFPPSPHIHADATSAAAGFMSAQDKAYLDDLVNNRSLAQSGYQRLPSGLIMQWGVLSALIYSTSWATVTFPLAFPNLCAAFVPVVVNADGNNARDSYLQIKSTSATGATLVVNLTPVSGSFDGVNGFHWIAFGY